MEPILLFREDKKIADEVATLRNFVPVYQGVYDAIKALGFTPTLKEISTLISTSESNLSPVVTDNDNSPAAAFVLDKMTRAAMPHVVNNITYPYSEVKKLMTLPDISALKAALLKGRGDNHKALIVSHHPNFKFEPKISLLTILDGKVSEAADAEAQITAMYSIYTQTDASTELTNDLQGLCDALNELDAKHNGWYKKYLPYSHTDQFRNRVLEVKGIAVSDLENGNKFIVSPTSIKKFEQVGRIDFL